MGVAALVVSIVAGVVGLATLAVTVKSLKLTAKQERRSTERSNVDWFADEIEPGLIRIRNQGLDAAHEVTVEVWDSHDSVSDEITLVEKDQAGVSVLKYRKANGPDPVDVPVSPMPRIEEDDPPSAQIPEVLRGSQFERNIENGRAMRDRMKAAQDWSDGITAAEVARRQRQQVSVRVTWRSELGVWSTRDVEVS